MFLGGFVLFHAISPQTEPSQLTFPLLLSHSGINMSTTMKWNSYIVDDIDIQYCKSVGLLVSELMVMTYVVFTVQQINVFAISHLH